MHRMHPAQGVSTGIARLSDGIRTMNSTMTAVSTPISGVMAGADMGVP